MTAAQAKKTGLSHTAFLILGRYQGMIKGGESFLSKDLKFAKLAESMYYLMVNRECVEGGPGIEHYTGAVREAAKHLWPEDWADA